MKNVDNFVAEINTLAMAKLKFSGVISHKNTNIIVNLQMYIFKEDESFIVYCPALDLSAYGDTEDNAKKAFEEILGINIEYMMNKDTFFDDLKNHGWKIKGKKQRKIKSPTFDEMLKRNDALRDITHNKDYTKYTQGVSLPV